jgi:hypothetical protein
VSTANPQTSNSLSDLVARSATGPRTTYARATREYDKDFERALCSEIVNAIARASLVTDPELRVLALRVGETTEALLSCLISFAALSPHFDVPSHLRQFAETAAKRIRRDVARARAEGIGQDFIFGARKGGRA